MKVLITGGAGFIGSHTAEALVREGHEVGIVDNRKDLASLVQINNNIEFHDLDVRDYEKLSGVVRGVDGIIHFAAVSRVVLGYERPRECMDVNVNGILNVLESVRKSEKRPWVIFSSSREVYGEPGDVPVSEDAPYKSANVYGVSKITGELLCRKYHENYGVNVGILRFSNVYGGVHDILDRVIPKFILRGLRGEPIVIQGGGQIFDFTYIDDTVNGVLNMVGKLGKCTDGHCDEFHLLTGKGTTLQDVVQVISDALGSPLDVRYAPPRNYDVEKFVGDPSKAENILGFKASTLPEKGIPLTIEKYREEFSL